MQLSLLYRLHVSWEKRRNGLDKDKVWQRKPKEGKMPVQEARCTLFKRSRNETVQVIYMYCTLVVVELNYQSTNISFTLLNKINNCLKYYYFVLIVSSDVWLLINVFSQKIFICSPWWGGGIRHKIYLQWLGVWIFSGNTQTEISVEY